MPGQIRLGSWRQINGLLSPDRKLKGPLNRRPTMKESNPPFKPEAASTGLEQGSDAWPEAAIAARPSLGDMRDAAT